MIIKGNYQFLVNRWHTRLQKTLSHEKRFLICGPDIDGRNGKEDDELDEEHEDEKQSGVLEQR